MTVMVVVVVMIEVVSEWWLVIVDRVVNIIHTRIPINDIKTLIQSLMIKTYSDQLSA